MNNKDLSDPANWAIIPYIYIDPFKYAKRILGKRNHPEDGFTNEAEHMYVSKRIKEPLLEGCRSIDSYENLNKIDEGAYGVVFRAREKGTREIVAIKKVKLDKEKEGFPITSIREINILLSMHHENIVKVKEVAYGSTLDKIFVVMEYMEHELKTLLEDTRNYFSHSDIKCLMLQLLRAVEYMHNRWIFHRDLKTSNLLLNNDGILKVCDFGLARKYGSPIRPYTHMVVTLWYRAPELLLGTEVYTPLIDMWSVGCIFAELLLREPLMMGRGEPDQLDKMFKLLGYPNESIWPGYSKLRNSKDIKVPVGNKKANVNKLRERFPRMPFEKEMYLSDLGVDLMQRMLTYDPKQRINASDALNHPWFKESPLPNDPSMMPKFPSLNEISREQYNRRKKKSLDDEQIRQRIEMHEGEERYYLNRNKNYLNGRHDMGIKI